MAMNQREEDFDEVSNPVQIKNRVCDGPVFITRNARQREWKPGQTLHLPRKVAEWFRDKSRFRVNPGDPNEGIQSTIEYKLVILGDGQDESDITREYVLSVKELLDAQNMPHLQRIDPKTGLPLRRVYIDPRSTGGFGQSDAVRQSEERVTRAVSSDIVKAAAEEIADAAQNASDQDIMSAVAELTGTDQE
jgi:hypothetical protein